MTDETTLKGLLQTATFLMAEGRLDEAESILTALEEDPDRALLGPETALGLPRRLHAACLRLAKRRLDPKGKIALQYYLVPPVDELAPLFRVNSDERRARVAASGEPVPEILHQIWIGSEPPETTKDWRRKAEEHGWDYRLWDEAALSDIGVDLDPVYRNRRDRGDLPGAVDVARYHVLLAMGGLYLDCDWLPVGGASFDEVFPMSGLSAMAEETPRLTGEGSPFLNNSVICAPREHPVFRQLLETLPEVVRRLPRGPAWWITGPLVFTLACRTGPVTVLDSGLSGGRSEGGRPEVTTMVATLERAASPAFLFEWKSWEAQ